ncbi:hypothetical protein [Paraliomyxa miuraensis]|uniref:hypothetical protein n=1 Tax=Paraliomyxa miuraensis TaxID=376150 RepID=UPI002259A5FC|nr:hypothetical protein [Paraliomyxa miuraensis]MCX4244233.1 hypothetical protein [Paraliomyxa miuraensis]
MVGQGIAPLQAATWVVRSCSKEKVTCPHCEEELELGSALREDSPSMVCPCCEHESLLVRMTTVLHRAVRQPEEVLELLGLETTPTPAVMTPEEVFSLPASRGSVLLLAMMWNRAEQTGSTLVEISISKLARRLRAQRGVIRGWLKELAKHGAVRELSESDEPSRVWELLPIAGAGEEVGRG